MKRTASTTAALAAIIICLTLIPLISAEIFEEDRIDEYHKRKHRWPPSESEYTPNTPGWRAIHQRRLNQTAHLQDQGSIYNAYMSTIHSALIVQNFTEYGWGLTKAPKSFVDALLENLMSGLEHPDELPVEKDESSSDDYDDDSEDYSEDEYEEEENQKKKRHENPLELPLMIPNEHLNTRALKELLPIHEAWANVKLTGNNAYGLRVYRNHSNLQMHIDESSTHIISSILHVGHDPDGEPWPLVIEDLHGNTHEVFLETGDMLLYESSKCFHGRPKRYNGKWYSSLFTHYYPTDYDAEKVNLDTHYRIPPTWSDDPNDEETIEGLEKLVVTSTSFKEPECEHDWCAMKHTIKSRSPEDLRFGQVVSTDGVVKSLGLDSGDEL